MEILRRHRRHEAAFSNTWRAAFRQTVERAVKADSDVRVFVDNVIVRLIDRPSDLLDLCTMLCDEALGRRFLDMYVRHDLADHDVIFALVETPSIFHKLPYDCGWTEVAVLLYGSAKLNESSGAKLTISEIAPLGLDVERATVRSLVGSAFDAGLLADEDVERLLTLFPGDPYFVACLPALTSESDHEQ